jgi:tight adherence protein B
MQLPDIADPRLLLYFGVFLGVLIAFEGLRQTMSSEETHQRARSRRLRRLKANASPDEVLALLRTRRSGWQRIPLIGQLPQTMQRAGIETNPALVFAGIGLMVMAFFVVGSWFLGPLPAMGLALAMGLMVPVAVLRKLSDRRTDKLVAQLPDALDLMARGLRVGHPLNTTIASVAKDLPQPIAGEFAHVADQVAYGEELTDAIADLAERVGQEDFRFLSAAVIIQHGSGGNLGRILATLSKVIRDRAALRRKVVAISSEGRLSALILSALPLVILGMTSVTSPSYYGDVSDDPLFLPIAIFIVVLVVANYLSLRKLVNFKV